MPFAGGLEGWRAKEILAIAISNSFFYFVYIFSFYLLLSFYCLSFVIISISIMGKWQIENFKYYSHNNNKNNNNEMLLKMKKNCCF